MMKGHTPMTKAEFLAIVDVRLELAIWHALKCTVGTAAQRAACENAASFGWLVHGQGAR